ncbi:MAG: dihydrofolate reductase family protein [Actinomycetota bacterium]|nr:dihydrofolate reductase family protein [Actinomycetota bacterium]
MRIVVMNHITLDGVMQSPGRVDEDTRDGFVQGGWATSRSDDLVGQAMGERITAGGGLAGWLFGRRTYEDLLGHWNSVPDSPFAEALNNAHKYVASTTLGEPLAWPNSTLLGTDTVNAVARLREEPAGVLGIMGSGLLIQALRRESLIDEYLVMIHPIVLGSGRRLFPDGPAAEFTLVDTKTSSRGVILATYQAAYR